MTFVIGDSYEVIAMRTEQEMYELLLGIAQKDERIRAVYMNG